MKIVLDTSVLVSALLSPHGLPAQVVDLVLAGDLTIALDDRILAEYRDVLARPKFRFDPMQVQLLLDHIENEAEHVTARPLTVLLPDQGDRAFLEVAVAAKAERHFPAESWGAVRVVTPAAFIEHLAT